ncbi:MAG: trypsin-like serine protease [Planctomycetota bacterium]|jgi:hypothetical protein
MKGFALFLVCLLLTGCSSLIGNNSIPGVLKERTYNYSGVNGLRHKEARSIIESRPDWLGAVVAVQSGGVKGKGYASGVCVGIEPGYSWVATAHHVVKKGARYVRYTWIDKEGETQFTQYEVDSIYHHPRTYWSGKDFSLLKIKGELPYYAIPLKEAPVYTPYDYDITVGYEGMGVDNKAIYEGRAEKGQSGGGVFHKRLGLFGVVSTHTQGVGIWECLTDMEMTRVVGDKR